MFLVTEAAAAAIRAVFEQEGELSAAIELRRLFPGITDNAKARAHVRTIAGWQGAQRVFGSDHMQPGLAQPRQAAARRRRIGQFGHKPLRHGQ